MTGIKALGRTLLIDTNIKAVLREHRWVTLPPVEWKFLMRISGPNWVRGKPSARERKVANRLRQRIGTSYVELVRGSGYRLGAR